MSKISIETLTCVHIGSGNILQYGNDFVLGEQDDESCLVVVDPRKVLSLIGEANIGRWVTGIEKHEPTDAIVRQFVPRAVPNDYAKRVVLDCVGNIKPGDTLKELMHNGAGKAYIPGSSIKGAIRTAVLASVVGPQYEHLIGGGGRRPSASAIEGRLFGSSPNTDVFRFLQVGDACFGRNYEVVIRMVNLNERETQSFWDVSKPQLVEALCPGDESVFELRIKQPADRDIVIPDVMRNVDVLFRTINAHTLKLLEEEIAYWQERVEFDESGMVDIYIGKIEEIRESAARCEAGHECVMRIGHGSGWRFMTGAWTEPFGNFRDVVVPASRPKNYNYEQYDFPKTRRVDTDGELLGFVKLRIL